MDPSLPTLSIINQDLLMLFRNSSTPIFSKMSHIRKRHTMPPHSLVPRNNSIRRNSLRLLILSNHSTMHSSHNSNSNNYSSNNYSSNNNNSNNNSSDISNSRCLNSSSRINTLTLSATAHTNGLCINLPNNYQLVGKVLRQASRRLLRVEQLASFW